MTPHWLVYEVRPSLPFLSFLRLCHTISRCNYNILRTPAVQKDRNVFYQSYFGAKTLCAQLTWPRRIKKCNTMKSESQKERLISKHKESTIPFVGVTKMILWVSKKVIFLSLSQLGLRLFWFKTGTPKMLQCVCSFVVMFDNELRWEAKIIHNPYCNTLSDKSLSVSYSSAKCCAILPTNSQE